MMTVRFSLLAAAILGGPSAQGVHLAPPDAPARVTVAPANEPGAKVVVAGRVVDADGRPLAGASIYVYQTDAKGEYVPGLSGGSDRPRLFGYLRSDASGRYRFDTVRPGSYPRSQNPAHIHFEVQAADHQARVYEIVFDDDPFVTDQWRRAASQPFGGVVLVAARALGPDRFESSHDIRIR